MQQIPKQLKYISTHEGQTSCLFAFGRSMLDKKVPAVVRLLIIAYVADTDETLGLVSVSADFRVSVSDSVSV